MYDSHVFVLLSVIFVSAVWHFSEGLVNPSIFHSITELNYIRASCLE